MAEAASVASKKVCFVVSPIGEENSPERRHADWVLHGIIEPVMKPHEAELLVVRADKIAAPGMIDSQIINHLLTAHLVIADMTTLNPNVFYELGIRHAKGERTIHMFLKGTVLPFDVKLQRAVPFALETVQDQERGRSDLTDAVREVLKPDFQVENPVTRAAGVVQLSRHATPEQQVLLDDIALLKTQMQQLQNATGYLVRLTAPPPPSQPISPPPSYPSGSFAAHTLVRPGPSLFDLGKKLDELTKGSSPTDLAPEAQQRLSTLAKLFGKLRDEE